MTEPDESAIARLTAAVQAIPETVRTALNAARRDPADVTAGEVWRVGTDEAQLVWVRRVFEDSAAVVSVTLDVEFADEYTLLIPADDSPISLDLAVMTTVEADVDMRAFLQHIADLPVDEQITRLRQARRRGLPSPSDLLTGPPISRDDDQRLEYRQLLADLLADLSPALTQITTSQEPPRRASTCTGWPRIGLLSSSGPPSPEMRSKRHPAASPSRVSRSSHCHS